MFPKTATRRILKPRCEIRSEGEAKYLVGTAAVYNEWSDVLWNCFKERLAPGCFDESLKRGHDIVATVNHDLDKIIGRTSSETLRIKALDDRIDVEVMRGEYSYVRDLEVAIERRDLSGMSFIFDVLKDSWIAGEGGLAERTVIQAEVYEVSFVYHPAYPGTNAGLRFAPLALPIDGDEVARTAAEQVGSLKRAQRRLAIMERL